MKGIFGSMFNLNHDGNISPLESTMEFMDADERREALEDAGLDPDEHDF